MWIYLRTAKTAKQRTPIPLLDSEIPANRLIGFGPSLASQRDGLPEPTGQLPGELSESSAKSCVAKPAARQFSVESPDPSTQRGVAPSLDRCLEQFNPFMFWKLDGSFYTVEVNSLRRCPMPLNLRVIESKTGRLPHLDYLRISGITSPASSHLTDLYIHL